MLKLIQHDIKKQNPNNYLLVSTDRSLQKSG
jgi:hypothetical protein